MTKAMILTIGLLSAGAISSAQTSADSYVMPKTSSPNFYLEAGPSYMNMKMTAKDGDTSVNGPKTFLGGTLAFGWRIAKEHKVQLEVGAYSSDSATLYSDSYANAGDGYNQSVKLKATAIPLLASYSYCIAFAPGNQELRISPAIGLMMMSAKLTDDYSETYQGTTYTDNESKSASSTAFAVGVGAGYTYHFSPKFYLDGGLRYLRVAKTSYKFYPDEDAAKVNAMNSFTISAAFGFKF